MATLQSIPLRAIKSNPYRDLQTYPWIESKLDVLMKSIQDVGMWEGIIARKVSKHYEIAFGHHRIESARRIKLTEVPLIVSDLSNERMLQYMGRENSEDYHTNFLTMLHTWEAGVRFLSEPTNGRVAIETIAVARLLGWLHSNNTESNHTARTCDKAIELIKAGKLDRTTLEGLTCRDARAIVGNAYIAFKEQATRLKDKPIEYGKQVERLKGIVKDTAKSMKQGKTTQEQASKVIRVEAFLNRPKRIPEFHFYVGQTNTMVRDILADDSLAGQRLKEILKILPELAGGITDWAMVASLCWHLEDVAKRATEYRQRILKIVDIRKLKAAESAQ
jgi:hypothetical protein